MIKRVLAKRAWSLAATGAALMQFGGCGLSDQQLASISQAVIQTGLLTLVTNIINTLFNAGADAAA